MPLRDHFHPPLSDERRWESFHAAWLGSLADDLNRLLPERYFAEEEAHAGVGVEVDVATFERAHHAPRPSPNGGGTATLSAVWTPPAAALTMPAFFADDFEIRVINTDAGPRLVAAIELISPRNKDRPEARRAFAAKCAGYLHQGINLILIDTVTERHAILHNELMRAMNAATEFFLPDDARLYAVAYRPLTRDKRPEIDLWLERLAISAAMPTLPLWLAADLAVPIDLEATYLDACRRRRID